MQVTHRISDQCHQRFKAMVYSPSADPGLWVLSQLGEEGVIEEQKQRKERMKTLRPKVPVPQLLAI